MPRSGGNINTPSPPVIYNKIYFVPLTQFKIYQSLDQHLHLRHSFSSNVSIFTASTWKTPEKGKPTCVPTVLFYSVSWLSERWLLETEQDWRCSLQAARERTREDWSWSWTFILPQGDMIQNVSYWKQRNLPGSISSKCLTNNFAPHDSTRSPWLVNHWIL